jgi:hypothetical protein
MPLADAGKCTPLKRRNCLRLLVFSGIDRDDTGEKAEQGSLPIST